MSATQLPKTLPYQPLRMSVEKYHQLVRAGAFSEHDAVELLDGVVTAARGIQTYSQQAIYTRASTIPIFIASECVAELQVQDLL